MNKNKSKAAYTTKWLNRNKQHWKEIDYFFGLKKLVVTKTDAPKIVLERAKEINDSRVGVKRVRKEIKMIQKTTQNPDKRMKIH